MMPAAFMGVLLQNSLGIFQAPDKTTWTASHQISFLGFDIDSREMTVAVNEQKYHELCDEIRIFLAGDRHDRQGRPISYCGKSMERIRGRLISNLIVEPNLIIYTSEQDKVRTISCCPI